MEHLKASALFDKYLRGETTAEENALVESWYLDEANQSLPLNEAIDYQTKEKQIWLKIQAKKTGAGKIITIWPRIRIAAGIAAAVATIVFGVWFFANLETASLPGNEELGQHDIAPGKNGATITLATGEVIQLDSSQRGVIIANGQLSYSSLRGGTGKQSSEEIASLPDNNGKVLSLTASTAKGQTYEFTLPDGSQVFLNADSRIIFPSQFSGKERRILLEGEAYFVVKHNEKLPFRVESKAVNGRGQVVEDIGTEFNINSYKDESGIKTTLLEGSASVTVSPYTSSLRASRSNLDEEKRGGHRVILSPNQQATLANGQLKVKAVEINQYIAWKNGKFVFEYETITSVMRKLARWYNVEVVYEGDFEGKTFTGSISRFDNISRILDKISYTQDVHFKIEGRRITVMP